MFGLVASILISRFHIAPSSFSINPILFHCDLYIALCILALSIYVCIKMNVWLSEALQLRNYSTDCAENLAVGAFRV